MNLRHIDPRSAEWIETIEEMTTRKGASQGDDDEEGKVDSKLDGKLEAKPATTSSEEPSSSTPAPRSSKRSPSTQMSMTAPGRR